MCLVLLAFRCHPKYPLVVAANRDEFYERPTADAHFWADHPHILAGRDLEANGTWVGVTRNGRFAAVTNFAETSPAAAPRSRGELTQNFLTSSASPTDYARTIDANAYRGYNLLLFADGELHYSSNRATNNGPLDSGFYGLANAELGANWPKVELGTQMLADVVLPMEQEPDPTQLLDLLSDRRIPTDDKLPPSDRPLTARRATASCFIAGDAYGTRASTCLMIGTDHISFTEQNFLAAGVPASRSRYQWPV